MILNIRAESDWRQGARCTCLGRQWRGEVPLWEGGLFREFFDQRYLLCQNTLWENWSEASNLQVLWYGGRSGDNLLWNFSPKYIHLVVEPFESKFLLGESPKSCVNHKYSKLLNEKQVVNKRKTESKQVGVQILVAVHYLRGGGRSNALRWIGRPYRIKSSRKKIPERGIHEKH